MTDIVAPEVRSRMMSGIRSVDTKPELVLRYGLHRAGFRYRLHARELPGRPDIVFPKCEAVIFANGCFWHGHDCHLFRLPSTRPDFWRSKIERNREVDHRSRELLAQDGWRVGVVWECALKGRVRHPHEKVISDCAKWLGSGRKHLEIRGLS